MSDPVGDYLDWLERTIASVDDATSTLVDLQENPAHDAAWNVRVTGAVSVWTSAYHNAMAESPPPALALTHVAVIRAFDQYNSAGSTVLQAASEGDDDLLAAGIESALDGRRALIDALGRSDASASTGPTPAATIATGTVPAITPSP